MDCVEGGASVSFMLPMTRGKARAFWESVAASAARGERIVIIAEDPAGTILGTVQVILGQPENQPHRGDVAKMLVHRRARRRGVGAALLAAAERFALEAGKTLLVLDTVSGSDGDRLYARQGWQRCGEVPNYALWPDGRLCATTFFYKFLGAGTPQSTSDPEFLRQFETCALPFAQWTHRAHVKVAYLYLSAHPFDEALPLMRTGIKRYNAHNHVPESETSGYNETTTHAFMHLIAASMLAYGATYPTSNADHFYESHPQSHTRHILRLFYSPQQRMHPLAKTRFIEPDLTPLPRFIDGRL
ncbi:MAG TPA: GNAT family N-acetyltransferase [Tepidisphaeraceae bacterium]|nr:GNAT family N-acetyltransferase [Tepidisphaeraceae bacterium]